MNPWVFLILLISLALFTGLSAYYGGGAPDYASPITYRGGVPVDE